MRITLQIDIETRDIPRLQRYLEIQPGLTLVFEDNWTCGGRFIGAKEALGIPETETKGGP
jgi:hypothetical protein